MAKVKELRQAREWSREQLAAAAGVSLYTVINFEQGKGVQATTARKIANALGVSLDELYQEAASA